MRYFARKIEESDMGERRRVLELFEMQKELSEKRVAEGIEKNRKGDACITVVDENGKPVPNAKVKVVQKNHEFRFGANLFLLDELETEEKNETYKKIFADTFNMATLPFYWNATEPTKGNLRYDKECERLYRRPAIDLCVEYCKEYGIEPREHGLAYEAHFPKWIYGADVPEVKREMERRYQEISSRYADKMHTIEVTNEMAWTNGKTKFYNDPEYIEYSFKLAEKYFPNNQLVVNEETMLCWEDKGRFTDKYYSYIDLTLLKGARIDAIGMQYHSFYKKEEEYEKARKLYSPEWLYKNMDLYARFGKPLQITEVTVPAYSNEAEDEEIQATLIEYLYSIWFSHPNVEQIVYWNVVDGYAHLWDQDPVKIAASQGDMTIGENYYYGGLLRFDMSPKPAYYTIKNLIQKKWHTEEQLVSKENGQASFRGFYGEYDIEIEVDGKKIHRAMNLSSKGSTEFQIEI